jgi:hypothetical protein
MATHAQAMGASKSPWARQNAPGGNALKLIRTVKIDFLSRHSVTGCFRSNAPRANELPRNVLDQYYWFIFGIRNRTVELSLSITLRNWRRRRAQVSHKSSESWRQNPANISSDQLSDVTREKSPNPNTVLILCAAKLPIRFQSQLPNEQLTNLIR